jgi:hypothetical protein
MDRIWIMYKVIYGCYTSNIWVSYGQHMDNIQIVYISIQIVYGVLHWLVHGTIYVFIYIFLVPHYI